VRRSSYLLLAGFGLGLGAMAIVVAVIQLTLDREIIQVLLVFAGMFATAGVTAFASLFDDGSGLKPQVIFDEEATRLTLEAVPITYERVEEPGSARMTAWEPTSADLLIQDRSLALAKLRIDLERELRRIAQSSNAKVAPAPALSRMTQELEAKGLIPPPIASAIRDVLPACNLAIHGAEVSMETAQAVLGVGADVLAALRAVPDGKKDPVQQTAP
jgi:hypothetical protein